MKPDKKKFLKRHETIIYIYVLLLIVSFILISFASSDYMKEVGKYLFIFARFGIFAYLIIAIIVVIVKKLWDKQKKL